MTAGTLTGPRGSSTMPVEAQLEQHRIELTGYCYRMLGSAADAEDAVQETLTRAWRHIDRFEGRAALRTWLYKIASNVCFDALAAGQKRAMPIDLSPAPRAARSARWNRRSPRRRGSARPRTRWCSTGSRTRRSSRRPASPCAWLPPKLA